MRTTLPQWRYRLECFKVVRLFRSEKLMGAIMMDAFTTALPTDFRGVVRLFPLNDLVLFPGVVLPLHIFESRYQEMLENAIAHDELVTMATLMPGFEHDYFSRPPVSPFVCVGRVLTHEKTPQGTYDLMLVGLERARIEREIEPVRSYRRAQVRLLESLSAPDDSSDQRAVELAEGASNLLPAMQTVIQELIDHDVSMAALTDFLSFYLPLPTETKLQLLAEPDPGSRAELLSATISEGLSQTGRRSRRPVDFSDN